jgi:hypothetical protein
VVRLWGFSQRKPLWNGQFAENTAKRVGNIFETLLLGPFDKAPQFFFCGHSVGVFLRGMARRIARELQGREGKTYPTVAG